MITDMILLGLSLLAVLLDRQVAAADSFLPNNFAFWISQSSLIVQNWLYIDGGEIWASWAGRDAIASHVWNQETIAIDLTTSWTTSSVSAVTSNKTSNVPIARRPDMWYNPAVNMVYSASGDFYIFGGDAFNLDVAPSLWGFKPQSNGSVVWEVQSSNITSNVAGASTATSPAGHISLGGYRVARQAGSPGNLRYIAMEEVLSFNFGNQSLYNKTLPGQQYLKGEAQYVPIYGKQGVILFFGGQTENSIFDLDSIIVYDIDTDTFFKQPASNAPSGRYSFCSVAAGGSSNESYEIFIYGGSQNTASNADDLSKVYILTVPAFHWIQVPNQSPIWRANHHCSVIGNRLMLSIGGIQDNGSTDAWATSTDPWANGLGIFDMTALNWTNTYDAGAAPYEPGSLVKDFYSTNARFPSTWGDTKLQAIFDANSTSITSSPTTSSSSSARSSATNADTTIGTSSNSDTTITKNLPAIVGGVIGGVIAVSLISIFLIWRFRRVKKLSKETSSSEAIWPLTELAAGHVGKGMSTISNSHEVETKANRHEAPSSNEPRWYELPGG